MILVCVPRSVGVEAENGATENVHRSPVGVVVS